jgi:hypothetical protein
MVHNSRFVPPWQTPSPWLADEEVPAKADPTPGDPARSTIAGGIAGLVGGWAALGLAEWLVDRDRLGEYVRVALGSGSVAVGLPRGSVWLFIAFAGLAGMLAGAGFGRLTRRLHGLVARLVFGAVLAPSVWIAVYAFGLVRFVPRHAELVPFVPWLLGALAFGVCVALARPVLPRSARAASVGAVLDDVSTSRHPSATASFLLLRRKA